MSDNDIRKVVICGAGIAGLSLAISLRQRKGIQVQILEQASVLSEVGAAISIAPNCARLLQDMNFDPRRARCVDAGPQYEINEDGIVVDSTDLREVVKNAGAPWWWIHRADMQQELLRLATEAEDLNWGAKAELVLGAKVKEVDCQNGIVVTEAGERYSGDLVVGADGVHSAIRRAVTGNENEPSVYSGQSAFRCLWDVEKLRQDPELASFVDEIKMDNFVAKDGARCLIYPCCDNEILNLFAPVSWLAEDSVESWRATGKAEDLVEKFSAFPQRLQKLLALDPKPALWQIRDRDPIQGWHKGKVIIIGDAAHPMLPHQGQGGAQAVEDGVSLPIFLFAASSVPLSRRLAAFESFRYPRVSQLQDRSRKQSGGPKPRPGKLPSIEMWGETALQSYYNALDEAQKEVRTMPAQTMSSDQDFTSLPYKNAKLPIDERVEDLLNRMTIAEKAGQMFHNMIMIGPGGSLLTEPNEAFGIPAVEELLGEKLMSHFNLVGLVTDARETAEWQNRMQERAQATRLGIPVTISTDPRNHFTDNIGTGFQAGVLSQWPETLGLAAIRSTELVERFANVARQEYLALGIRLALHPQIDLATEPRWARIGKTFGEDADLSSELVAAYIRGFQGPELGPNSVSTMTKHFPGGGPEKDGEDSHFTYGKEQVYPGKNMEYHIRPFRAAIAAGAAQMMPYYSMPVGTEFEEVGFGFNKCIITGLLREDLNFTGIICTDWGLVTDATILGQNMPARAWGVEHLSELERVKKIIDAGCDQFGGESRPELVIKLVEDGLVSESRIDASVRLLLREKFTLGLFENPFVDVEAAVSIVGKASFREEGDKTQRRAFTLLTNKNNILPLKGSSLKVYIEGIDPTIVASWGLKIMSNPSDADIALMRLKAPYEPRSGGFEAKFNAGSLEYSNQEKARQAAIFKVVPTIVDIYLDRAAVIPEIVASAAALMASYGSSGNAFLDIVLGKASPEGKLPFDLPSSMKAVEESRSDMPYDTENPVFRFGHGLSYPI